MMKQIFILVFCIQLCNCCNSQNNDNFDLFLNKFTLTNYPIGPVDVFHSYTQEWKHYISETEFNTYLRTSSDSIWHFDKDHQFVFGGKFNASSDIVGLFYRRVYFADDVDNQISEVILCTFNYNGEMLSSMPVAGGYGDSITFSSIIHGTKNIEVNYKKFNAEEVEKSVKYFEIRETGEIRLLE